MSENVTFIMVVYKAAGFRRQLLAEVLLEKVKCIATPFCGVQDEDDGELRHLIVTMDADSLGKFLYYLAENEIGPDDFLQVECEHEGADGALRALRFPVNLPAPPSEPTDQAERFRRAIGFSNDVPVVLQDDFLERYVTDTRR